ncbi:MAG: hypothetical protein V2B14_01985 [bacterium]
MSYLVGKIKGIKYDKCLTAELSVENFDTDVNEWSPRCCIQYNNIVYSISKWVSPKGYGGDLDYLQWDTISLMSLLNVYVIIGYYIDAEISQRSNNKITCQKFDNVYIKQKIEEISNYHSSALHWNIDQLKISNLNFLMNEVIKGYCNIQEKTGVKLHKNRNLENFKNKITSKINSFMIMSREKSKQAQNREFLTIQPKEALSTGKKTKIEIENYLGGNYFFTIDDVMLFNNIYNLIESKHSRNLLMPSLDDIKDGLIKMIVYSNINELKNFNGTVNFIPVLRLTSPLIKNSIASDLKQEKLHEFIESNNFSENQIKIIDTLFKESYKNNFKIIIENAIGN